MNGGRDVDVDSLFERDADSRLLERRRREELGLAPQAPASASTPASFGAESIVDETEAPPRSAMLRVSLDARPERELIPGALVTIVVSLHDEGDADAPDARLRIALPPELEAIEGSFVRDELAVDGEALLGEGLRLGAVRPGAPVRVRFSARVLPGTQPLDVVVHASAAGVPAVAAPALRLRRRAGHAAYEAPRPFYELEANEVDATLGEDAPEPQRAVDAVLDEPVAPPVVVSEPEAVQPEPVQPEPVQPEPAPQPVAAAPEPEPIVLQRVAPAPLPEPEPPLPEPDLAVPEPVAAVADEVVLTCAFGLDDVRACERVFAGAVPHGLAAIALLSAIACTGGEYGAAVRLEPFRSSIAEALPRALVAARMRKPTPPVVTRAALDALQARAQATPAAFVAATPSLVSRLNPRDLESLRGVLGRDLDDAFLRGMQVLLAIAPRALEGTGAPTAPVTEALTAYRASAGAWLMRVTVRRAVDKRYDPLTAADAALHEAGRTVVAALRKALA